MRLFDSVKMNTKIPTKIHTKIQKPRIFLLITIIVITTTLIPSTTPARILGSHIFKNNFENNIEKNDLINQTNDTNEINSYSPNLTNEFFPRFKSTTSTSTSTKTTTRTRTKDCNKWAAGKLTDAQISSVLNAHNWYRNAHATQQIQSLPFATNMLKMFWDEKIAARAQEHANRCQFEHSSNDFRDDKRFKLGTGENLYENGQSDKYDEMNWYQAVNAWYEEIKDFKNHKELDKFTGNGFGTGHFTQVMWAKSYLIGCGFAQFQNGGFFRNLYVCEYGPAGNVGNYPIYKTGPTQACNCPKNTSCNRQDTYYKGLCCPNGNCDYKQLTYSGPVIGDRE